MKILVLTDSFPPYNLGGAGEVAELVSCGLAQRGHEVLVVTGTAQLSQVGLSERNGAGVRRIWSPVPSLLRLHLSLAHPLAVAQVRRIAAQFRPDVVHAHNVHERLSFASLGAARVGAPLVLTAHDYLLFCLTKFLCSEGNVSYQAVPERCTHCIHIRRVPRRNAMVHGMVRRHAAAIACISDAQRTAMRANGFGDVPLVTVHNGIDSAVPMFDDTAKRRFRSERGIDGRPLVFFGGRISGAKGGDQLLRAMVEARKRVDCQVAVAGDRERYFKHARRLADEIGLEQNALHTLGWLEGEQLGLAFQAAQVIANPSVYPDPFNLMNLRAMAHARPVVGTCYGGTVEIVVDGVTGQIADPWKPAEFGARLADLLTEPGRATMLGEAGRERLARKFTLDHQVERYVDLFDRVRRPGARPSATTTHIPNDSATVLSASAN